MTSTHFAETTSQISSMLIVVAGAFVVAGIIGFLAARWLGGKSKPMRQATFSVVSGICFLGITYYVYLHMAGRT